MFKRAYIEITNACNLSCSFCHGTKRSKRFMSPDEFRTVAEQLRPYTDYIYLHVMGEPLLHPKLADILDIASELGFHINITTNGTLLGRQSELLLRYPAIRKVSISLHSFEGNLSGYSDPASEASGSNSTLTDYLDTVWSFASRAPYIIALRLWNEGDSGLHDFNTAIVDYLNKKTGLDILSLPCDVINGRKLRERLYLESAERFEWPDLSAAPSDTTFCYALSAQIGVLADGTVIPCCLDSEGTIALGNLLDKSEGMSLSDILASPRASALREGFASRRPSEELCRHCDYASRFSITS